MIKSRLLVLLALTLPALPLSAEVTIPHVFNKGQKAVAAEVNANFSSTATAIWSEYFHIAIRIISDA